VLDSLIRCDDWHELHPGRGTDSERHERVE
jgi:hypothetical protein